MAKIAILTVGIASHLNSGLEIAKRLEEAGHSLVFASTHTRVGERVTAAGYTFYQLDDGVPAALKEQLNKLGGRSIRHRFERRRIRAEIAKARGNAALEGHGIEGLIGVHTPSLWLIESELHESILYLLGTPDRAPIALLEHHVSIRRRVGVPPLKSTYVPRGRMRNAYSALLWSWMLLKRRVRQCWSRLVENGWDRRSVWIRLAVNIGAPFRTFVSEAEWPLLYYPSLPHLQLCIPQFDFRHPPEDDDCKVGPMVQQQRHPPDSNDDALACRQLLSQLASSTRPLIVCASGSILTLPKFVDKVVAAADGADFDLIIATGRGLDPASLGELPANVHAFRVIPQLEVLAQATAFICHAGITSIHESLLAGVPLLAYSAGAMDENGNAARVEFHGLGVRGNMRGDSAVDIRHRIDKVLSNPGFANNVAAVRLTLERYAQEERFCRAVDRLIGDSKAAGGN